jgi:hypothetical protein
MKKEIKLSDTMKLWQKYYDDWYRDQYTGGWYISDIGYPAPKFENMEKLKDRNKLSGS